MKDFGKVAVLMGGRSAEREISLMSGKNVLEALQGGNMVVTRRALLRAAGLIRTPRVADLMVEELGGKESGLAQGWLMDEPGLALSGTPRNAGALGPRAVSQSAAGV